MLSEAAAGDTIKNLPSLNPCFSGICSLRLYRQEDELQKVLILVLVEYALWGQLDRKFKGEEGES